MRSHCSCCDEEGGWAVAGSGGETMEVREVTAESSGEARKHRPRAAESLGR